jgi:YidC/Oxa1 family membrane protein insertase
VGAEGRVVMEPLFDVTSAVLIVAHSVLSGLLGFPQGAAWVFAIIGVTVATRVVLLPVFVRQIYNRRKLQALQPRLEELKREYGHSPQRFRVEKLKLYATVGTKPYLSWLPLLVTLPVLFALFHTLLAATGQRPRGVGLMSDSQAESLSGSILFDSVRLSDTAAHSGGATTIVVAACLVAVLTVATFLTQHRGLRVGMPASTRASNNAQQQKILLYMLPAVFVLGGVAFPIGVLIFWVTESLWALGEELWVIRNYPLPEPPP